MQPRTLILRHYRLYFSLTQSNKTYKRLRAFSVLFCNVFGMFFICHDRRDDRYPEHSAPIIIEPGEKGDVEFLSF